MTQVTVRRVEEKWVAKAKADAAERGVSMNTVLLEAMGKGLEMIPDVEPKRRNNLDQFAGDSAELFDEGFDEAMREQSEIDPEMWK